MLVNILDSNDYNYYKPNAPNVNFKKCKDVIEQRITAKRACGRIKTQCKRNTKWDSTFQRNSELNYNTLFITQALEHHQSCNKKKHFLQACVNSTTDASRVLLPMLDLVQGKNLKLNWSKMAN